MLVSAISPNFSKGYTVYNTPLSNKNNENIGDTAFNSLTPFANKKVESSDDTQQDFRYINEWKNFCHNQIVKGNFNVIA